MHGDLTQPDSLVHAFRGLNAVINNASPATGTGEALASREREAVQAVLRAVNTHNIRRVVHISSVSVYRDMWPYWTVHEHHPRRDERARWDLGALVTRPGYAVSKAVAEAVLWSAAERSEPPLELTVLRPGPVYGERDPKVTQRYRAALAGRIRWVPTVGVPHVHAADVGMAVVGALRERISIGTRLQRHRASGVVVAARPRRASRLRSSQPVASCPCPCRHGSDGTTVPSWRTSAFTSEVLKMALPRRWLRRFRRVLDEPFADAHKRKSTRPVLTHRDLEVPAARRTRIHGDDILQLGIGRKSDAVETHPN